MHSRMYKNVAEPLQLQAGWEQGVRKVLKAVRYCQSCHSYGLWKKCSGCKAVNYCTSACQASDWPAHQVQCRTA